MAALTLLIGLVCLILGFLLKPARAMIVYCIALFAYPEAMTVQVGEIDWNAPRIAILGVLLNVIFRSKSWRGLHWNWLDTFVLAAYLGPIIAVMRNVPFSIVLERQIGGAMFNVLLPYLAARMVFHTREDLLTFLKGLVIIGLPLACFAVFEAITGRNVYSVFYTHYGWGMQLDVDFKQMRSGFYRAYGSFGIAILLGLFFSAVATLSLGLWKQHVWGKTTNAFFFLVLLGGVCASVSSAPLFAIVISLAVVAVFPLRRYWVAFVVCLIAASIFVEVYSNRHFYHVLTLFSFNSTTAYYRIHLLEEAFGGGMAGHWLFGYGYVGIGPGNDNSNFFWKHQDLTNVYVAILARFGLIGLLPYLVMNVMYYRKLYVAAREQRNPADLWLIWCVAAALVGWNISMMTVAAFRQVATFQYILIAVCNNMPLIVRAAIPANQMAEESYAPPKPTFRRPPWRYSRARPFDRDRQLERPGFPAQMPDLSPKGDFRTQV